MEQYTASNGYRVELNDENDLTIKNADGENTLTHYGYLDDYDQLALREFFRAEEDERLGRWRWPDSPRYIVRRSDFDETYSYVFDEETFELWGINGFEDDTRDVPAIARDAARAYFDAHPEPKPWHNAKPGEVWAVRFGGAERETAMRVVVMAAIPRFHPIDGPDDAMTYGLRSVDIVAGRRIWPEGDPS